MKHEQTVKTVRDSVYQLMRDVGVTTIFGNPGSTELPMFRDFPEDFEYVLGLQEAVVVGMADGYAQASQNVAFVNLHSAAGVGNAMGNIYTAFKNRTPLVIVAGQQARSILQLDPYLASVDATELPKPYVKWSCEPARAEDVPQALARAYQIAMQAPMGPVLVSVPSDDWDRPAQPVVVRKVSRLVRPEPHSINQCANALASAQKPALVVGAEVDRSGAWDEAIELAERLQASVYVAPFSARCSFPEDHPLFAGFLPASREPIVAMLGGHDVVLVIGAPVFTYHVEGSGPFIPTGSKLFQITEDSAAAAWAPVGTSIVADSRLALVDILSELPSTECRLLRHRTAPKRVEETDPLSVAFVLQTIADLRSPEDVFVEEAPTARLVMHEHLPMLHPRSFYTMSSGGLGYGMPAAAGIALARKSRVFCLIGDGSSMYSIQTLWTAAQLKLNIVFIVLNNGKYGAMKRFGKVLGFPEDAHLPGTDLPGLDFSSIGAGHGCPGVRATNKNELSHAFTHAANVGGPFLIDAIVQ
ncbi:benzoylformate decarboxylase [Burkholderia diffusa]|uniref:Benzoylformate decarboxylase n=1 Tax=Burkholderia diffusa TaxID=488732 RepID=A0AAW3P9Y7_9BURK|nr:benzoylformate decarboxylase [Burkholderia diffusa]KWF32777.1 benzoylformate decarboxylase [Burkholderia diffusa]KWF38699.1 benzoylformate decarboxylase [Burkholderia diffusa]KWF46744.1 benzoylformate decarboxylase [Burkholderia diffusa]KWF50685.1 benzoylformate decarboxylase [Burkholderia diffusa]